MPIYCSRFGIAIPWISLLLLISFGVAGQDAAVTDQTLSTLQGEVAASAELNEEQRAQLSDSLSSGAEGLEQLRQFSQARRELLDTVDGSEQQIRIYNSRAQDIRNSPASLEQRLGRDPSLNALENEVSVAEQQRAVWVEEREKTLDLVAGRAETEAELASRIAEVTRQQQVENTQLGGIGTGGGLEARVNRFVANITISTLKEELALLELRLRSGPALNRLRSSKIAWLDSAISDADSLLLELRAAATEKRQNAAAQRRAETQRLLASAGKDQVQLAAFAEQNLALIDESQQLSRDIEATRLDATSTRVVTEKIQQDVALTQRRLQVAGLEAQLGDVMISRLGSLPDVRQVLAQSRERNDEIAGVSISVIDTEQALRALSDKDGFLTTELGNRLDWTPEAERAAQRLYQQRRELLQEKLDSENTLLRLLVDENQTTLELATVTEKYKTLLTANLLWVRNYTYASPARLRAHVKELVGARPLRNIVSGWPQVLRDPTFIVLAILLLLLISRAKRIQRIVDKSLSKPLRPRDESPMLLVRCLLLTLIMSMLTPLLMLVAARALALLANGDELLIGLFNALDSAAAALFLLGFFTRISGRLGVGPRLLKWNTSKTDALARDLRWFRPGISLTLAITVFGLQTSPIQSAGGIAALGSFSTSALLALFTYRLLSTQQFAGDRIQRYSLRAVLLTAASILFMHLSGQLFAAHLYLRALVLSSIAVTGVILLLNIIKRVLTLYRASLGRKDREEQRALATGPATRSAKDLELPKQPNNRDSVESLSEAYTQIIGLIRILAIAALIWVIWSPALPALSVLDSITLWTTTDSSLPAGTVRSISLSVLLVALFVLGATFFVTRQLPPLVNVVLVEFTQVSSGSRYAAGMLMQYLIIGIGFSTALAMLGFQWGKVQWLVAALGVGIGFGLQEIVANFISGLIVLFERPIRVGDIINAGGADGVVTRINARATVMETFEGKELMIPNKELITSVVTNWSLSSPKLRVVVAIGVAYGSDVNDAMRRLKAIADNHSEILEDPEPFVTFEDFGDNALLLWLRCYAVREYAVIESELRKLIYADFNDAGISIAFPQRDIHIDASAPLPIRILSEPDGSGSAKPD